MGMKELLERLKNLKGFKPQEDLPENMAYDPHLRSLRREKRKIEEEHEKKELLIYIKNYKKEKLRQKMGMRVQTQNTLYRERTSQVNRVYLGRRRF